MIGIGRKPTPREILDLSVGQNITVDNSVSEGSDSDVEVFAGFATFEAFAFSYLKDKKLGLYNTPCIPESVYNNLPAILKRGAAMFKGRERDIWLISALAVMSGIFHETYGQYRYDEYYPNLFSFIIGPQVSGKGVMKFARRLGKPINEQKLQQYLLELKAYQSSITKSKEVNAKLIQKPIPKLLFIPGDISAAELMKALQESEGVGIICESEADTLTVALQKKWGHFDDKLRNIFDNQELAYARSTEQEYVRVKLPRLSLAITGTPDQLPKLVESAQNGLFSRMIFYIFKSDESFDSVAPKNMGSIVDLFDELADEIKELNDIHEKNAFLFELSAAQIAAIDKFFKDAQDYICENISDDLKGFVIRQAVICFKIAMILSILRNRESIHKRLSCSNEDVNIVLQLAQVFLQHSIAVYMTAYRNLKIELSVLQTRVLSCLPDDETFRREEAIDLCKSLTKSNRTIDDALKILVT